MTDKEFIQGVIKGDFNAEEIVDRYKGKTNGKPFYADLVEAWDQISKTAGGQSAAAAISYALLEIEEIMMGGRVVFEQHEDSKIVPIFVKDSEPQQAGKDKPTEPQQIIIPDVWKTEKGNALLQGLIDGGFCTKDFKWLKTKALLAYLGEQASDYLGIGKGEYDGRTKTNWKPFAILFNIDAKKLAGARNDYKKTGTLPCGSKEIDNLFS